MWRYFFSYVLSDTQHCTPVGSYWTFQRDWNLSRLQCLWQAPSEATHVLLSPFTADTILKFLFREKIGLLVLGTYHCSELFTHLSLRMYCWSYFILHVLHFIYIECHVPCPKWKLKVLILISVLAWLMMLRKMIRALGHSPGNQC